MADTCMYIWHHCADLMHTQVEIISFSAAPRTQTKQPQVCVKSSKHGYCEHTMGDSAERIKGEVCWFWLADSPPGSSLHFLKNANASVSGCMEDQEEEEEANEEHGSEEVVGIGSFHFSGRRRRRHTAVRLGKLSLGKAWQQSPGQLRGVYPLPQRHGRDRGVWVQIEEWKETEKRDRGAMGGLKKNGSLSIVRGRREEWREREGTVFCSHLARSLIQNVDTGSWRRGEEGEYGSPQFCVWREKSVCITLILFTVAHTHARTHTLVLSHTQWHM